MNSTIGVPNTLDKTVATQYEGPNVDIRIGGLIRIPVCGAEEAEKNLGKGRDTYSAWPNYPCNP